MHGWINSFSLGNRDDFVFSGPHLVQCISVTLEVFNPFKQRSYLCILRCPTNYIAYPASGSRMDQGWRYPGSGPL